jgi:hypothetical protein
MPPQERRRSARGQGCKSLSERTTHSDCLSTVLGRGHGEQMPLAGHALEFMRTALFELEP